MQKTILGSNHNMQIKNSWTNILWVGRAEYRSEARLPVPVLNPIDVVEPIQKLRKIT